MHKVKLLCFAQYLNFVEFVFVYEVSVIFDCEVWTHYVRDIRDPEHPYSLEQLSVLSEESITVDEKLGLIL